MKPGYKTTEFWLALISGVVGFGFQSGAIVEGTTMERVLAFLALALTSMGYSVSRGLAKKSNDHTN